MHLSMRLASWSRHCVLVAALSMLGGCAWLLGDPPPMPRVPGMVDARPRVTAADQLPRTRYPVDGLLDALVRSPVRFATFAAPLRRDLEAWLLERDIADPALKRELLATLAALDYLDGRPADCLARLAQVQALQERVAERWTSGLRLRVAARAALQHAPGTAEHAQAVAVLLRDELQAMPAAVVVNEIRDIKAAAEVSGEALTLGRIREVLQPMADAQRALGSDTAPWLVSARLALTMGLPLKSTWVSVLGDWLDRHRIESPDVWTARSASLPQDAVLAPVPLAVWDSGVDTALFRDQLLTDADGRPRVIGFDRHARPVDTALAPLPPNLRERLPQLLSRSKGFADVQANVDGPEAAEVKRWLSGLGPTEYRAAIEELNLIGNYAHGTHVAGIALAGNPHVRLVVARIEFGHTLQPDPCPSRELVQRDAANAMATVAFFRGLGVRVVNMSWGGTIGDVLSDLEKCGIGRHADARRTVARELFDLQKGGLMAAIASAPEILFIAAAGNDPAEGGAAESTPAQLVLPNLLAVGAVDQAGREAGFTSDGPTVRLHANGDQVESWVPGGTRMGLSGSSMAAPQIANLAAKLLAVRPSLTPPQLIEVLLRTADTAPDGRRRLVHPQRALAEVLPR